MWTTSSPVVSMSSAIGIVVVVVVGAAVVVVLVVVVVVVVGATVDELVCVWSPVDESDSPASSGALPLQAARSTANATKKPIRDQVHRARISISLGEVRNYRSTCHTSAPGSLA